MSFLGKDPMEIIFTPQFRRQFKKLPIPLQEEALSKIELFAESNTHQTLRVHKLQGRLSGRCAFSVNYKYRIVFIWGEEDASVFLLAIGDHGVYD